MRFREMTNSLKEIVFPEWEQKAQQQTIIKMLWRMIGILVLLNGLFFIGWKTAPTHLRIFIPPNIEQGGFLKVDSVPPSTVYAFAYQIFTALNTWTNGGEQDYKANIYSYKNYFSDKFFHELLMDYTERSSTSALNRNRIMSGVTDSGYDPDSVKSLGNGTWLVNLKFHIVETVDATVVKDVLMDYGLRIARIKESIQLNPWGLQIVGLDKAPERVKTVI
ncbi:MAG: integrating conjugative element protein family [Gammaproteobacteria bacterium]|nr:integrating conjugative element protein family [Gammaproteobacteria bacterium]